MNRAKCAQCPVCKTKLLSRSFEAPQCPKCQTVFPNIFRQIQPALDNGSHVNLSFIHHVHLDEVPLPSIIFQKLAESNTVEDLTFRRSRVPSDNVLSVDACKGIEQLLKQQKKLWHFAFDCPVDPEGLPYISRGLSVNQTLQEVDLSFSSVYEAEQLAKGIAANKSITRMSLSGSLCSSEAVIKSFEELQHNQSLVEVKLENLQASSDILACLKYLPASVKLKLSNIKLSNFTDAALEDLKHCKALDLEISYSLDSASFGPVMKGLAQNSTVKKLVIVQKNGLDNRSAEHVADLIARNSTLAELSINAREDYHRYNYQPKVDNGFQAICQALQRNESLTSLDLGIGIRSDLSALGDALLLNKTLKVLNLSWNHFNGGSLSKLCEALKVNVTLQSLNLSRCALSRVAMLNLSAVLPVNKTLTDIDFSHHDRDFTYGMYLTLCNAIKANSSLKKVVIGSCHNLFTNQWSRDVLFHVAGIIKSNPNITSLSVLDQACQLATIDCAPQFIAALKSNNTLTTLKLGPCIEAKALENIFATNYWLLEADFCSGPELCKYLKRNLDYRKRVIANTMVLCENIFRSQEAMDLLPPELWMHVFSQLIYPGIGSMAPVLKQFIKYRNSKQQ